MKKCLSFFTALLVMLSIVSAVIMSTGCSRQNTTVTTQGEGFAIYLTKDNIPPSQMEELSHVEIADTPIIGINDIVTYNLANHNIKLTQDAFERILNLKVPTSGKSFVVCVNKSPIYWGAFWTPISSQSFDGITILMPFGAQSTDPIPISTGYPAQTFYRGTDPRNNQTVLDSLRQSGKLINDITYLPRGGKGYELYSWHDNGQWNYTLITGTNRNETIQEIITGNNTVTEDGWVNIHVVGLDAIVDVLKRLQPNENVIWGASPTSEEFPTKFELPPAVDVDAIKAIAVQGGWALNVMY